MLQTPLSLFQHELQYTAAQDITMETKYMEEFPKIEPPWSASCSKSERAKVSNSQV